MIDTINFRLYGINDIKKTNESELKYINGGISQLCVIEHQMLFWKLLEYKGKGFVIRQVYNKQTKEFTVLNETEYLAHNLSTEEIVLNDFELNHSFMEIRDGGTSKKFATSTRGKMGNLENERLERASGEVRTPSSINYVQFKINPNGRYIEFEFSIPKYLYGHSLAQFIPQPMSETFSNYGIEKMNTWKYQTEIIYKRLISFIEQFLTDLCRLFSLEVYPNLNFIEIKRIDLCFNQFFDSKENALLCLEQKRKLYRKKQLKNSRKINETSYDTTLQYRSSAGSYFKIYHKGTEYSKTDGDRTKHLKINNSYLDKISRDIEKDSIKKYEEKHSKKMSYQDHLNLMKQYFSDYTAGIHKINDENLKEISKLVNRTRSKLPFDVIYLKNEMDKVLRYEVSISGKYLKELYKKKIFRKNDLAHIQANKIYQKVKKVNMSKSSYKELAISRKEIDIHKMLDRYYNRKITLLLIQNENHLIKYFEKTSISHVHEDYNQQTRQYKIQRVPMKNRTAIYNTDVGTFTNELLFECIQHFKKLIAFFKIDVIEPLDDFTAKVDQYNKLAKINLEKYNNQNYVLETGWRGKEMRKGSKIITKPSQLLTDKQKRDLGLQQIMLTPLLAIVNHIKKGNTMKDFFLKHRIKSSASSRYKLQLEKFQIMENSLIVEQTIKENFTFSDYYTITSDYFNQVRFFRKDLHLKYN